MSQTPLVTGPRGRDVFTTVPLLAAILVTVLGFGVLGGAVGMAVGLLPVVVLFVGGPLLAFIAGSIGLVGTSGFFGPVLVPAHVVLMAIPVAALYDEYGREIGLLAALSVAVYVSLFVAGRSSLGGVTEPTVLLALLAAVVSYGIHRYELLTLGLIDE